MIEREGVISRWSRRKLQSEQDSIEEDQHIEQTKSASPKASSPAETLSNEADDATQNHLTDEDMPAIDSLSEDSDFSAFMSPGVSEELRNLALKKLFRSQVFNVCDGLDEYDEDYTSFESLGDIVTCDMKHQLEMEAKKKLELEQQQEALLNEHAAQSQQPQAGEQQPLSGVNEESPTQPQTASESLDEESESPTITRAIDQNHAQTTA